MEALVAEDLTRYYGKLRALDKLSLKVERGSSVGLLGPNGAGKSTTMKILCHLLRPSGGRAYINGINVSEEPKKALGAIGAIIEVPEFYPFLTPTEILSYLGRLRGMPPSHLSGRIKEVLTQVNLNDWAQIRVGKFSRGMKQRLGIAQAMLHDPPILILDEPALGLDPRGMREIRDITKSLTKEGKTILLASHMLYEVRETCEKVALIDKGKLLTYNRVSDLEKVFRARKLEVETLQPPTPQALRKIAELKGVKGVEERDHRLFIDFEGDDADRADLLRSLEQEAGLRVSSFKTSTEALEEIYLQLIKEAS